MHMNLLDRTYRNALVDTRGVATRSLLVPPLSRVPKNLFRHFVSYMMHGEHIQHTVMQCNYLSFCTKNSLYPSTIGFLTVSIQHTGTLQLSVNVGEPSQIAHLQPQISTDSLQDHTCDGTIQFQGSFASLKSLDEDYIREIERRRKIGIANKGKTPWNKGRTHSQETRELIKQRTREAMRNPKVRERITEPRARIQSDEIRAKIGASQKLVWRKRLKLKKLKEKLYLCWAETIAEAAKRGGPNQQKLDWDSYEKLRTDIELQRLQWFADKANRKAEKMARMRSEKEEAKARKVKDKMSRESKEEIVEIPVSDGVEIPISEGFKLKARITEIRREKGQVMNTEDLTLTHQPAIEKLDLEFVKREKQRREVSLADQIQAAKERRAKFVVNEFPKKSSINVL